MLEAKLGFIAPVISIPRKINALGAVAKSNGKWRRITDLSEPEGNALNELVDAPPFQFESIDDAVQVITQFKVVVACKFDLQAAYRQVPVHVDHWDLCGFVWEGVRYVDLRLCFGYRRAPFVFWKISNFIKRVALGYFGVRFIIPYLDDFLIISPGDSLEAAFANASHDFQRFESCLYELGWEIARHKVVTPSLDLTFLGIRLNLVERSLSVPDEKLTDLLDTLEKFSQRKFATKKQLQKLVGLVNFACKVVRGGRTFLRRMIDELNLASDKNKPVQLSYDFQLDVLWWLKFARAWNGKAVMIDPWPIDSRRFVVDASGKASAAIFDYEYLVYILEPPFSTWHINATEFLSVVLAAKRWGPLWSGHRVIVESDNTTTVAAIYKGSSASREIMRMLRHLFWISAKFNFHITARHISGSCNELADAASRLDHATLFDAGISMVLCPEPTVDD